MGGQRRAYRSGDRLDPGRGELDHQPRRGGEGGPGPVHDGQGVELLGAQRDPAGGRGQAGQQLLGGAARDDGVREPHADQLDGRLDVLHLDPGDGVPAGLVEHLSQHDAGGVDGAPRGLGHHQRGAGEAVRRDRGPQPLGVGADVDELVARDRRDLHALAAHGGHRDHRGLEPAPAQVLLHVVGVLADQLDPDARVAGQHVGDESRRRRRAGRCRTCRTGSCRSRGPPRSGPPDGPRPRRPAWPRRAGAATPRPRWPRRRGRRGGTASYRGSAPGRGSAPRPTAGRSRGPRRRR